MDERNASSSAAAAVLVSPLRLIRPRPPETAGNPVRPLETKKQDPAQDCAENAHLLDLFVEDSQLNVYAGELEVRPPGAPTTRPDTAERGRLGNHP